MTLAWLNATFCYIPCKFVQSGISRRPDSCTYDRHASLQYCEGYWAGRGYVISLIVTRQKYHDPRGCLLLTMPSTYCTSVSMPLRSTPLHRKV